MLKNPLRFALIAITLLSPCLLVAAEKPEYDPTRWQKTIDTFKIADQANPPAKGDILFVGSSSIRLWNLAKWFPNLQSLNRGFGGSEINDSTHFAETLILKHHPRIVVFYAGDNDIASGNTPEQVHADFLAFQKKVQTALPETQILYIAIKPSLARWKKAPAMQQANQMIATTCNKNKRLTYIDIWTPMLGEDGRPRKELFRKDGLHLNNQGYQLWTALIEPLLAD